jgi:hypothetical protein
MRTDRSSGTNMHISKNFCCEHVEKKKIASSDTVTSLYFTELIFLEHENPEH